MPFITIFLFGALAGSFALILELLVTSFFSIPFALEGIFSLNTFFIFLLLALIEEVSKFTFLLRYKRYSPEKSEFSLSSFIFLALLFGIGFSSLEILLSLQNIATPPFFSVLRTFLLHIGTSLLFVYYLFYKRDHKETLSSRNFWLISSAILIHLTYNIILFLKE